MPSISHVHRRGAVYYWRRRLPKAPSKTLGCSNIVLSLGTKDQAVARQLAAILDSEAVIMVDLATHGAPADHKLTADQIKSIFRDVALRHLTKLDRVAVADRLSPNFTIQSSRSIDICMGHVYRLLATEGAGATVDEATASSLLAAGLSDTEIGNVSHILTELRRNNMTRDPHGKLEALLSAVGATSTPINLGIAQTTKHRAMAAALFNTKRRWDGDPEADAILLDVLTQVEAARLPPASTAEHEKVSTKETLSVAAWNGASTQDAAMPVQERHLRQHHVTLDPMPPVITRDERGSRNHAQTEKPLDDSISVVVENLLGGRMANVAEKTKRQIRSAGKFFSKYLVEVHGSQVSARPIAVILRGGSLRLTAWALRSAETLAILESRHADIEHRMG